jgi:DNA-binding NtrC family response regulator
LIAATHPDLGAAMHAGSFRPDLYYRICADVIRTPTVREQLAAAPDDLHNLLRVVAGLIAGAAAAERLTSEVEAWVAKHLGRAYAWPGNVRELEQCVRNILVRGAYTPPPAAPAATTDTHPTAAGPGGESLATATAPRDDADAFIAAVRDGTLTADQLLQGYCARVRAQTATHHDAARRLGLDWRTVRDKTRAWAARRRRGSRRR